jgi:hypothetical protein
MEPSQDTSPSLQERIAELSRRVVSAIDAHPWELVGVAALLGAWLGLAPARTRPREKETRRKIGALVMSSLGAIAIRAAREAALRKVGVVAKRWWDESAGSQRETDLRH